MRGPAAHVAHRRRKQPIGTQQLVDVSADEAEALANAGEFGKGSMEPKVRAAIKFVRSRPGRTCIIGALDKAPETMAGLSGTRIHA